MKNNLLSERLVYNGESHTPTHFHLCSYGPKACEETHADDFAEECSENNGIAAALPQNDLATVTGLFTAHGAEYAEEKDNVSFADIGAYIGENDPFFAQE